MDGSGLVEVSGPCLFSTFMGRITALLLFDTGEAEGNADPIVGPLNSRVGS